MVLNSMQKLIEAGHVIKALLNLNGPCALGISDRERFIFAEDNMGMEVIPGDLVKPGSATEKAMREGRPVVKTFDGSASKYGVDYTSMSLPVLDEDQTVIGCLSWTTPTEQFKLARMSEELSGVCEELAAGTEQFARNSTILADANTGMLNLIQRLNQQMENIKHINTLIAELASQSQLLGLNASIEAAHAGEHGLGFAVVASEIRKLAVASQDSAKNISSILVQTINQVKEILATSQNVSKIGEQQAQGAMQLSTGIEDVNRLAGTLFDLSNKKA